MPCDIRCHRRLGLRDNMKFAASLQKRQRLSMFESDWASSVLRVWSFLMSLQRLPKLVESRSAWRAKMNHQSCGCSEMFRTSLHSSGEDCAGFLAAQRWVTVHLVVSIPMHFTMNQHSNAFHNEPFYSSYTYSDPAVHTYHIWYICLYYTCSCIMYNRFYMQK